MSEETYADAKMLWELVGALTKRVNELERRHEPMVTVINEHDDRLDDVEEHTRATQLRLDKLDSIVGSTNLWMQGISRGVEHTNLLLERLIAMEPRK